MNLFWALGRMTEAAESLRGKKSPAEIADALLAEAKAIHEEDRQMCRAMGRFGAELLADGQGVLTHCNAGGLATADYGTALAVFFAAAESGKKIHVYADETRPLLQGGPAHVLGTSATQHRRDGDLRQHGRSGDAGRQGAGGGDRGRSDRGQRRRGQQDRHLRRGPVGQRPPHSVLRRGTQQHLRSFAGSSGDGIPIEQRDPREITHGFGRQTVPEGVSVYNPAFDVTPAPLVKAIICEHGVIEPVNREQIASMLGSSTDG